MPRTQSRSRGNHAHLKEPSLAQKSPSRAPQDISSDTAELAGSGDTPQQLHTRHKKRTVKKRGKVETTPLFPTRTKLKHTSQIPSSDVIEISSDEGDAPPTQESIVLELRSQVKRLQQEHLSMEQDLVRCQTELKEASKHKCTDGKLILDPSKLDDGLNCEICMGRMYTPCLLPDCGHTSCLSCLRDWFGTIHARFLQANPHWSPNALNLYERLQQLQQPVPEYTCPKCRKRVYRRPVEVYALKSLVRTISELREDGKEDLPPDQPLVQRRHGHLVVVDPWDGYFPNER